MTNIDSEKVLIRAGIREIFDFLADFRHFEHLMPEQVSEWSADRDQCSFNVQGISTISMKMTERIEHSLLKIVSEKPTPVSFFLSCNLDAAAEDHSEVQLRMQADLNPLIRMVASKPLENLLNIMVNRLKEFMEQQSS